MSLLQKLINETSPEGMKSVRFSDIKQGRKFFKKNNTELELIKTEKYKFKKNLGPTAKGGAINFKIDSGEMVLIKEEAAEGAVAAHDIAVGADALGSEPTEKVKVKKKKKKKTSLLRRTIAEMEQKFDQADVISKLKAAEKSATIDQDTVAFGLEDEDGNMVKVHVRAEQAEDFQAALETALAGNEDDETEDTSSVEIAEVLFELKDKFEIVDIEWGAIPEDEEENQEIEGEGGDELGLGGEEGDMGDEDLGDEDMVADEDGLGDEEVAATALTQVIDMMKADSEAKKAEADAKKAEAEAKTAGFAAQAAAEKVKQEEDILDMETYNKSKADADKESKRLAQLAKYKHDMAGEADVEVTKTEIDVAPEEEEESTNTLNVDDLVDLLRKRLQAN